MGGAGRGSGLTTTRVDESSSSSTLLRAASDVLAAKAALGSEAWSEAEWLELQ